MYTFWKRTSPPPALITFDAPDREKCTARRTVTNTPLQALVLLNDPTYVEAARVLAERMMIAKAARIQPDASGYAFRLATAREPDAKEVRCCASWSAPNWREYRRNKDAAREADRRGRIQGRSQAGSSELAAWTTVASTI